MSSTATVLHTSFDEAIDGTRPPGTIRVGITSTSLLATALILGQGNWDMWYDPLAYFILGGSGHLEDLCIVELGARFAGMLFCAAMNAVLLNKGLAEFEAMTPASTDCQGTGGTYQGM